MEANASAARASHRATLVLEFSRPFDWQALRSFFQARAVAGCETVTDTLQRSISINAMAGHLQISRGTDSTLTAKLDLQSAGALSGASSRVRAMFDLDADIARIESDLRRAPGLGEIVARQPGLRVPGCWSCFECGVRAIIGQQVTVAAAQRILGRLVAQLGEPLAVAGEGYRDCNRLFPGPAQIAGADLQGLGLTRSRAATLGEFARRVVRGELVLDAAADPGVLRRQLLAVRGIGPWTTGYILMRGWKDPDAFPAGDSALLAAARRAGIADSQPGLETAADAWRPWRAYAAMHLWRSLSS